MTTETPHPGPALVHGRLSTYTVRRCRCRECTTAAARWKANKRRQVAYGRWQPLVDAQPVREHLRQLLASGLTRAWISRQSAVPGQVVRNLTVGNGRGAPTRRVRPATAEALLAVRLPAAGPPASRKSVPATASRRKVQALASLGFPISVIAHAAGLSVSGLYLLLRNPERQVAASTAERIAEAYDRLWDARPADLAVRAVDSRRIQRIARANRWAPPLAWDEDRIGDPEALPDWTGRCGSAGGYYDHTQLGTPTCQPCRDAVRAAATDRKLRRRARAAG
ncbi:hypothetical protein GCM10010193_69480 [Kitasatospora atroaurantiaca]|uniref:Uncharacterized protein n=1 Tax=Kitasatospora atroaurantiaca TaxID=285545 RepID=A0A561EN42_9ACTN|nr:hypothetical protein [Kitasatospora atroaurantiaca]TWE17035.1 hypothetical protein FB465_2039 [Kitasatospora atroaurantiaca]